jgi:hypothetical protein
MRIAQVLMSSFASIVLTSPSISQSPCTGSCAGNVSFSTSNPCTAGNAACGTGGFSLQVIITPSAAAACSGSFCTAQCDFQITVQYQTPSSSCIPLTLSGSECGALIGPIGIPNTSMPPTWTTVYTNSVSRSCNASCTFDYVLNQGFDSCTVAGGLTCVASHPACN